MSILLESLAGHLVPSKTSVWHLVNAKKSLKFDSIQNIHDHIWFMPNGFDRTKYEGPFGTEQCLMGDLDRTKCLLTTGSHLILTADYEIGAVSLASLHTQGSLI